MIRPHDKNGIPVYPGDVLKTFHFVGPRKKRYYLYHVAVERDGYLSGVPASSIGKACEGGTFLLTDDSLLDTEIVEGVIVEEGGKICYLPSERK